MLITHTFVSCIRCGEELEVLDEDRAIGDVECPHCGYVNELDDVRLDYHEREF